MNRILIFILLVVVLVSCKGKKPVYDRSQEHNVLAIKYMGTVYTTSVDIDEQSFWELEDEHAYLKISNTHDFIDKVKTLPLGDKDDFTIFKYAFIVSSGFEKDTIYADYNLKSWMYKENKDFIYKIDSDDIVSNELKNRYSFFYDCW